MGEKLHIAVDLDDVVLAFGDGVREAVAKEYGVQVPEFRGWNGIGESIDPIIGRSWWEWMEERDWLWAHFDVMPGAIGGLSMLRERGHYVEILTTKPLWAEYAVWKWLGKWRPPVQRVTIVGLENSDVKAELTEADVIVDDNADNIYPFIEDGRMGILYDRPHNQEAQLLDHAMYRAMDWRQVVALVDLESEGELK